MSAVGCYLEEMYIWAIKRLGSSLTRTIKRTKIVPWATHNKGVYRFFSKIQQLIT